MTRTESPEVLRATAILRGRERATPAEMLALAEQLKNARRFGSARQLLARARAAGPDESIRRRLRQQHALCTYKDLDLPTDARLESALAILQDGEDLGSTRDQETLGLVGAIYKRRWEADTQKENLERALFYYLRGYREGPENDQGYTGINAAYVADLLAHLESRQAEQASAESGVAEARREQAGSIRRDLLEKLPALIEPGSKGGWWLCATLAEASCGLGDHEQAVTWIERGLEGDVPEWERKSTAMQLGSLARIQAGAVPTAEAFLKSPGGRVLDRLLGGRAAAVRTAYIGKVGLGLSGGGFRASLYHIGVLAKLAELDVLQHVEVLSCVSGGSILGAHYYLEAKQLLESKADDEITREDWVALVERLADDFLDGVQENVRTRVAAEFTTNARMIFQGNYSRTMRAGELYERCIYSRVGDGAGRDDPRWLTDLYVAPKGESAGQFLPREDNWRRRAKVPDLILNATSLNTGHNWQFTASWMGEPPGSINTKVDGNYRLRRMYYSEAPEPFRRMRLGHAVASSACVPGLFEPLSLPELYPGRTVRLVDGGVHDNQGVVGLLEHDCNVLLVSDACGQMGTEDDPSAGLLGVPLRSNSILMNRVRSEQFDDLVARNRSGLLRGLMFIHLKQGLGVDPVDWVGCEDPHTAGPDADETRTEYGILKEVQQLVAGVRTDLDSFCDQEAFALMTSGYRMTGHAFDTQEALQGLVGAGAKPEPWGFLAVEGAMTDPAQTPRIMPVLSVASKLTFKVWSLVPALKVIGWVLTAVGLVGGTWLVYEYWSLPLLRVRTFGVLALGIIATALFGKWVMRIASLRSTVQKIGIGAGFALGGCLLARLHLWIFDKWFLRVGRVRGKARG